MLYSHLGIKVLMYLPLLLALARLPLQTVNRVDFYNLSPIGVWVDEDVFVAGKPANTESTTERNSSCTICTIVLVPYLSCSG